MRTVVLGPRPPELEQLIAHRHRIGADIYDEVWEGAYHMAPMAHGEHGRLQLELANVLGDRARPRQLVTSGPVNIGVADDFRVPDLVVFREWVGTVWYDSAAIVVEVRSPDDESWEKLPFYAAHRIEEVIIVDPQDRSVAWFALAGGEFRPTAHSAVLDVAVAEIVAAIDWPPHSA